MNRAEFAKYCLKNCLPAEMSEDGRCNKFTHYKRSESFDLPVPYDICSNLELEPIINEVIRENLKSK